MPISYYGRTYEEGKKIAEVDNNMCIGCAVCDRSCPVDALHMEHRESRVFTPVDMNQKLILQALETNTLQHLIFRDPDKISHRFLASVIAIILKLPPAKQLLASTQLQSRYLKKQIKLYNQASTTE